MNVVVIPAPGELCATASLLLSLADDVRDVRTVSNGTQFEVPDYLADRYHTRISSDRPAQARRRGRSPKIKEG